MLLIQLAGLLLDLGLVLADSIPKITILRASGLLLRTHRGRILVVNNRIRRVTGLAEDGEEMGEGNKVSVATLCANRSRPQGPGQRGCAAAGVQIASAGDASLGEAVTERQWEGGRNGCWC